MPFLVNLYHNPQIPNLQHEILRNVQGLHWLLCGTSEIEHRLCACTVDNPLATARGLSPYRRTNHALSLTCEEK